MSDPEKLVDPADFLSIKLGVSFKNLVSGTEVDIKSAGLDEIGDSSVVLSLPANSCAIDHNVMFHVYQSGAGAPQVPLIFVATGKVSQIEDAPDSRSAAIFTKYLENRKVLIADPSSTSRSGLYNVFRELGAKSNLTILVSSFNQAQTAIESEKPHIVVAEFELGKRCGLDLLQKQREFRPLETKETLFIIATGNTSQSAVARAAEEDIDAYIIKPITPEVVRKTVMKAAIAKIRPPEYVVAIEDGKKAMAAGSLDEAQQHFERARKLDPAPALACAYLGQLNYLRKILDAAQGNYESGLQYNRIHYKCMVGLYEVLMGMREHTAAYEVVRRIAQYFPANPKRLAEVLRLAIVTGKYEDIEKYYAIFINLDDRDETLIKYICSALVVCGKYYLSTKVGNARALELFRKASATSSGRPMILREIILSLIDYRLAKEAEQFLAKFPPEDCNSDDFLLMRFLIKVADGPRNAVFEQGRTLLQREIKDMRLFTEMIKIAVENHLPSAAEQYYYAAIKAYPDKKAHFDELLGTGKPETKAE
ncbi:MAG: response regulator [Deltaproteobacteria bacterium]|nr:response regulator [Deltaproteobacteria bacterium]